MFDDLAGLLGQYQPLGFSSWSLHVRSVVFRHKEEWLNFATAASMDEGEEGADKMIRIRDDVALIVHRKLIPGAFMPHQLSKALTHWRTALNLGQGLTPQAHVQLQRVASDIRRNSWPGWRTQLHFGNQGSHPLPDGPFFDPAERIFGQDLPRLAVQFLGSSKYGHDNNSPNDYVMRIPDRRARIRSLRLKENLLQLDVENPAKLQLFWSIIGTPFVGDVFHTVADVDNNQASVELPFRVQKLETWLILCDGYMLDYYQENPNWSTWGPESSLFHAPDSAKLGSLDAALASGETDTVEFKAYIRIQPVRDKKALEILQTVSAFANTRGGDLFIGVTDEAEPVGVEHDLNKDYGKQHSTAAARRGAFAKDVRKLINEGTAPTLELQFTWHDPAHHDILQVRVPKSETPVHLHESGELYRRHGGSNKKWRAVDAMPPLPAPKPSPLLPGE